MAVDIAIVHDATAVTPDQVKAVIPAMQVQLSRDFCPAWGIKPAPTLHFMLHTDKLPNGYWPMFITDNSDTLGALGYHSDTKAGVPDGFIFAETTINDGLNWTVTLSHELLEMTGDSTCQATVQYGNYYYAKESADPCEGDEWGYLIDNILVSDFILYPSWFTGIKTGIAYDFTKYLMRPRSLIKDGYYLRRTKTGGWKQITAARHITDPAMYKHRPGTSGRSIKRIKGENS